MELSMKILIISDGKYRDHAIKVGQKKFSSAELIIIINKIFKSLKHSNHK